MGDSDEDMQSGRSIGGFREEWIKHLTARVHASKRREERYAEEVADLRKRLESAVRQFGDDTRRIAALRDDTEALRTALEEERIRKERLVDETTVLRGALQEERQNIRTAFLRDYNEDLSQQNAQLRSDLAASKSRESGLRESHDALQDRIDRARGVLNEESW